MIGGLCVAAILAVAPTVATVVALPFVAVIVLRAIMRRRGGDGSPRVFVSRLLRTVRALAAGINPPAASRLVVVESDTMRESLRLDGSIILGRKPDAGVYPVGDKYMNARHARVYELHGWFMIEDLDTKNGTFLNGDKLKPHVARVLRPGDVIRMGNTVLRLQ